MADDIETNPGPVNICNGMFTFSHMNVNSLRAHDFIRVKSIEAYNNQHNCDIIAVTETALSPDIDNSNLDLTGYTCVRRDLPPDTTHGGVLIYHRDSLALKTRPDLEKHPNILVCEITVGNKILFFTVVYRRFGQTPSEFNNFIEKFDEICQSITNENPYCMFFVGDFNAHLKRWGNINDDDNFGIALQNIFDAYGLFQLVDQPTYITKNSSSCIDLVITDQPNIVLESDIHPALHTNCNHQINFVKINVHCPPPPPYNRRVWHFDRANVKSIQRSLTNFDWEKYLGDFKSIDEQVNGFNSVLDNIFANFIPFSDIIVKPKDPPWVTKNLKTFYNKYRKQYRSFIKRGRREADKINIDLMREQYTNLVELAKEKYLKSLGNKLSDPYTGAKSYWSALKILLKKNIASIIPPIIYDSIFVTDPEEKCVLFNNHFAKQCTILQTDSVLPNQDRITPSTLKSVGFAVEDILKHIRGLNPNKAHGHDGISIKMLQICDKSILKPLRIIYSNCIEKGYFPEDWKKANVIPIYKKNSKQDIQNYRPISLLPICGKIFENIIFDNLYRYIFSNKLISDRQSGFRKGDSTIKQLISITHDIYQSFDCLPPKDIRAIFLDISKAFDKVWHEGLLFKLKRNGVDGNMLSILSSFLSDRYQRVTINGKNSDWSKIGAGVPQGSVLGPLLFLIYINDLVEVVDSEIRIFADDTFIFQVVSDRLSCTNVLNNDLRKISNWARQWKMAFNPDISKQAVEVQFSSKKSETLCDTLVLNGIAVKNVCETKHLGLILDSNLTFVNHINEKIAVANQGIGLMKQLYRYVPRKTLEEIYKLYVRPFERTI